MERKEVERYLKMYFRGEIQDLIDNRKEYLTYPPRKRQEGDVKVQTSSRTDSPQESLITKIESDNLIMHFSRIEKTIDSFLKSCSDLERRLLRLRYQENAYWAKVEIELNFSERQLRRKRDDLLEDLKVRFRWLE